MNTILVSVWIPWVLTLALFILLCCTITLISTHIRSIRHIPVTLLIAYIIIVSAGIAIRFFFVPNQHRIYYDEDRYLTYAVTFSRFRSAEALVYATKDRIIQGYPDQAVRLTIPVLNAWIFTFFGYTENNAFIAAKIASSIQILLIGIVAYLLYKKHSIALIVTSAMALLPPLVYWSPSIGLDNYFVFFSLVALTATLLYAKRPNKVHGLFVLSSLTLLICVRLESMAILPVFALLFRHIRKSTNKSISRHTDVFVYCTASVIILLRAFISFSVIGEKWCCAEGLPLEAFHPIYFIRNILPNLSNLFTRYEFPAFFTVGALIAIFIKRDGITRALFYWFSIYFLLYSTYYAGMLYTGEFSGSYGRYFLILIPPLILLSGSMLHDWMTSLKKNYVIMLLLITIIGFSTIPTVRNYQSSINRSPYYALVEEGPDAIHTAITEYIIPQLPPDAIFLSSLVSSTVLSGRSGALFGMFLSDTALRDQIIEEMKKGTKVYSTAPYQCIAYPQQCEKVAHLVDFEPIKTIPGDIIYAEIKLKKM